MLATLSGNDTFEMDSAAETEETDGDLELGMIDEELGKRSAALVCVFCRLMDAGGILRRRATLRKNQFF